eukprot:TRINITY_DN14528_c0_g1_i1.p1 TRINITY_DN14528_c0_g1~~TRINITY_DN14528_c0_g1_i1.p1  ORF type:complete len:654 (-),score=165.55 TRINITY_DN14528_c0_g1_i1:217-2178(-)
MGNQGARQGLLQEPAAAVGGESQTSGPGYHAAAPLATPLMAHDSPATEASSPTAAAARRQSAPATCSAPAAAEDEDSEKLCRYCFEGDEAGELIAPCRCAGGQRWVHLSCLRRWQRGVLVSQPTHPDFYDDDTRHRICGVCKSAFTCRPPTRLELMQSFTGEEMAALVEEGCFIGTHCDFSAEMKAQVSVLPEHLREEVADRHWIEGAFLIVKVVEDRGSPMFLRIAEQASMQFFTASLSEDFCWQQRGRMYRLVFEGQLEHLGQEVDLARRREAVRNLQAPCTLKFVPADCDDSGEDGIMAVNLTRPIASPGGRVPAMHTGKMVQFSAMVNKALPEDETLLPKVTHFVGGPCHENRAQFAIVGHRPMMSGGGRNADGFPEHAGSYEVFTQLHDAIVHAQDRCVRQKKNGSTVKTCASDSSTATVSTAASTSDSVAADGSSTEATEEPSTKRRREEVSPSREEDSGGDGSGSADQEEDEGEVFLHVFWGSAGWSRCQLIGEIASGSWGLCKSQVCDVTVTKTEDLWNSIYRRMIFAPKTEMSENYCSAERIEALSQARLVRLHRRLLRRRATAPAAAQQDSGAARGDAGTDEGGRDTANEDDPLEAPQSDGEDAAAYSSEEEEELGSSDEDEALEVQEPAAAETSPGNRSISI